MRACKATAMLLVAALLGSLGCNGKGEPKGRDQALQEEVGPDRGEENDSAKGATPGAFAEPRRDVGR